MESKKVVKLHPLQSKAFNSKKRIIILCSGIQGGKTMVGACWMLKKVKENMEPNSNFLVLAPTHKIFAQATEPRFLEYFANQGEYNRTEKILKMPRNRNIYLRTLHDPNAIEGCTNVKAIWADELGMVTSKAWVNIEGRSAFEECQIAGTTTPYALNWLWRDIYKPWKEGNRDDVDFIQFASTDNPYFPKAEFERQKKLLDPRVFAMKYEGKFERMAGLVYPDLDDELNYEDWPKGKKFDKATYYKAGGIDFGFNNPFAVSLRALHRREPRDYQFGEFYRSFLDTNQMIKICLTLQNEAGIEIFYADSEDPQAIADLSRAGVHVVPVEKGRDSVRNGIITHNALIRSGEYKMVKGKCPHTEDEYATYHYPEDKGEEENLDEKPVDANNHLMSANRYVSMMTKEFRLHRDELAKPKIIEDIWAYEKVVLKIGTTEDDKDWYND